MANSLSITSATAVLMLSAKALFPVDQHIQGFAVDDAFDTEELELAHIEMGVDGKMSAGYVPNPTELKFTLQANSAASIAVMNALIAATKAGQEIIEVDMTLYIVATGQTFVLTTGTLEKGKQFAAGKKVLGALSYTFKFQDCSVQ